MEGLNVKPATHQPKATEEIDGMIRMIGTLIEKGHAYEVNGTVYFKTRSFDGYGKLSKRTLTTWRQATGILKSAGKKANKIRLILCFGSRKRR